MSIYIREESMKIVGVEYLVNLSKTIRVSIYIY